MQMSESRVSGLSWLFVALALGSAVLVFRGAGPAAASGDHDEAHELRNAGNIIPLSELMGLPELAGQRVLEAELEREDGRMIYELELLDDAGRVHERYYDAVTGQPLRGSGED
jgi:uncharacterized membrane protein YkoI